MAKPILDDDLWALIEPLLPAPKPRRIRYSGRKPLDNRAVLTGILFVLQTGLHWDLLPREIGCGSGMSCRRRPRDTSRRQAYGTSCTRCCLRGYAQPTKSTGLASSSTHLQSALWVQVKNRTESHRPRASRFKAPSHHRSAGHPARGDTDRRQSQRRHSTPRSGRGYPAHQRQAWQTTIEASGRSG